MIDATTTTPQPVTVNPLLEHPPRTVTIHTERLQLDSLQESDFDDVFILLSLPEVMRYTTHQPFTDRTLAADWIRTRALSPDSFNFCVRLRDASSRPDNKGTFVGVLGAQHAPMCGYLLHPSHHNRGYATEALRAFSSAYFTHITHLDHLKAGTDPQNLASGRVLSKAGFTNTHRAEQDFTSPTRGVQDTLWWYLPRPGVAVEDLGIEFGTTTAGSKGEEGSVVMT